MLGVVDTLDPLFAQMCCRHEDRCIGVAITAIASQHQTSF
jgi:hypothetical protein